MIQDLNKNIALVRIRFVGDGLTVHCPLKKQRNYNYSLVAKDGDACTEILVSAEEIDKSMTFPEAEKLSWKKQFELLFGNRDGFEGLIKYCDENEIGTQIYNWD